MLRIQNSTNFKLDEESFSHIAKKVLLSENRGTKSISLAIVESREMRRLNKEFRQKDKPTDVLSFRLDFLHFSEKDFPEKDYLGEVIICPKVIEENSKKYGISSKKEIARVFIHGILHLLGYDHERSDKDAKIMDQKQESYLKKFFE